MRKVFVQQRDNRYGLREKELRSFNSVFRIVCVVLVPSFDDFHDCLGKIDNFKRAIFNHYFGRQNPADSLVSSYRVFSVVYKW